MKGLTRCLGVAGDLAAQDRSAEHFVVGEKVGEPGIVPEASFQFCADRAPKLRRSCADLRS